MRIYFGTEFDHKVWGGPSETAAFDEATCGPLRLAAELESQLGLPTLATPLLVRAAALLPHLPAVPNAYWSRSADSDALGTAMRLVRDYDALTLAGWQPGMGSPRLQQLAALCVEAPKGLGDRLRQVVATLDTRTVRLKEMILHTPRASCLGVLRTLVGKLERAGVAISQVPTTEPTAKGDLGVAARQSGEFVGDGSLQFLAPWGAVESADHVAAWLAADRLEGTVIVSPDAVLDTALARHGLPTLGIAAAASPSVLQLVPLCLAMGWAPINPRFAVEMLSTDPNPLSPGLRYRLLDALAEWPAVDSPAWRQATEQATEVERQTLSVLFTPHSDRLEHAYATDALLSRCGYLKTWLGSLPQPPHDAIALCETLQATIVSSCMHGLSEGQMQRLLSMVMSQAGGDAAYPAQVGLTAVSTPAAVLRPARRIVWWNFHADTARVARPLPLSHVEHEELLAAGLALPTPGQVAAQTATAWRQPLLAAQESLLLVSPSHSAAGEAAHPHPLWDEILASVPSPQRAMAQSRLVVDTPTMSHPRARHTRTLRSLPQPTTMVKVLRRPLKREGPESPSSLESLFGCSFRWALNYLGSLDKGSLPIVTPHNLHTGRFAHRLLQDLVLDSNLSGDDAANKIVAQFDAMGPTHVAPLFLPGASAERDSVRGTLDQSVRVFFQLRSAHGWRVVATETAFSKPLGAVTLCGNLDVLLDQPAAVIDFKWGGSSRHRDKLRQNTALQLAAYSWLVSANARALAPIAYFILTTTKLWTPGMGALPGGVSVGGDVQVMWRLVKAAALEAQTTLGAGHIAAAANLPDAVTKDAVVDGKLRIAPPCGFCSFSELCGVAWNSTHDS